ncbi:MAG TPA: peptidylprolyl isomerase [Longimicrobiales bacterium]
MDMTRFRHSLAALAAAVLACAAPAALLAQNPTPAPASETIDRIIAVVGDSIITDMNLQEDMVRLQAQGQLPKDPTQAQLDGIRRQLLEGRVNYLVLVQAAERDTTIKVAQDQVSAKAQQQLDAIQRSFVSPEAFNQALALQGMTQADLRLQYEADARRNLLIQAYIDKLQRDRKPPIPNEDQIRKFFDEQKATVGQRPATVTFRQIVVAAQPSDAAKKVARAQADSILAKIRAGEDFAALAKHYSEDPGTKEKGGDLGWFRRGQMVQSFEDAAYQLVPGEVSGVVESPFGFHIIKLEKIRGAERSARHILIKPLVSNEDTVRAVRTAQEVAQKLKDGTVSFDSLVARYNDPTEQQTKVGPYPKDKLPPPYDTHLVDAKVGDVIGPFRLTGDSPAKWAVVKVEEVKAAGEYSLNDPETREQVRDQVQRQLLMDEIIGELKRRTFVDIRG